VREKDVAVIVSLHELDLAEKVSDRVVCVANGRIDRCDVPEKVFSDDYITTLYGIENGSYNALFGSVELPGISGKPQVFVIGGGGSGIPVYRALQRAGMPFAAGILPESDLDFPVAKALAAALFSVSAFSVPTQADAQAAKSAMLKTQRVVCTVPSFGETNTANQSLYEAAKSAGILTEVSALLRGVEA
jgi:iron complex transport system ATP-binding protein